MHMLTSGLGWLLWWLICGVAAAVGFGIAAIQHFRH